MCILMLGYKGLKNGEFEKLHRRKCKKNCSLCLAVQDDLNMSFGVCMVYGKLTYFQKSSRKWTNRHVVIRQ